MKEQFSLPEYPIEEENKAEKVKEELKARPDVHENIEKLRRELDDLLTRYTRGEKSEHIRNEISGKWWNIFDQCILYSENQKALKISTLLEAKFPDAVKDIFGGNSPLVINQPFLSEVFRPLPSKWVHKVKAETKTHLGHKNRNTERSGEECLELLDIKDNVMEGEKVLEVGAGKGNFSHDLKQKDIAVTAIDPSWGDVEESLPNLKDIGIAAEWKFLPFKNSSFDRAVSVFAFPLWVHTWQEMEFALREMIRVVKKGGSINLVPAAPVLEKGDIDARTRKKWGGPRYCDTIYRREFEQVLQKFVDQVEVTIGEPHADFNATSQIDYFPLKLKVIKKD